MKNNNDCIYINNNEDENGNTLQSKFKVSKTSKIEYLIDENKFSEALDLINKIIESDKNNYKYWNLKAIILNNLSEYDKSVECFNKALSLNETDKIKSNKANTLYEWAKLTYFPQMDYEKALKLINDALDTIPKTEDASEYYFLKSEILETLNEIIESKKYYLMAHKEFNKVQELEEQNEYLHSNSDTLINITGSNFYNFTPQKGIIVDLVKQDDNEYDPNAIAVMINNSIVGYVANSNYTLIDEVSSANDIRNLISNNQKAEILFVYLDNYIIAKLI